MLDKEYNASFHQNLEQIQYKPVLLITGAIRGIPKRKTVPRVRIRISQKRTMVPKTLVIFVKSITTNLLSTSLLLLLCLADHTLQDTEKSSLMIFLKTHLFLLL